MPSVPPPLPSFFSPVQAVEKALPVKERAAPGAPKKKKRKRDDDEGDDEGGIDINPPDDGTIENGAEMPALSSMVMIELDVPERGFFYCTIEQYDDDGSVIMNIFREDYPWKLAHECDECQECGHIRVTCDACGVMRPQGVLDTHGEDQGSFISVPGLTSAYIY